MVIFAARSSPATTQTGCPSRSTSPASSDAAVDSSSALEANVACARSQEVEGEALRRLHRPQVAARDGGQHPLDGAAGRDLLHGVGDGHAGHDRGMTVQHRVDHARDQRRRRERTRSIVHEDDMGLVG